MNFNPGFSIVVREHPWGFRYGSGVFGPAPEYRSLDSIRKSLHDPSCQGPDPAYAIVMDVGKLEHRNELIRRKLLFGAVTYAAGRLGAEPVRSQGHIHQVSAHSGWRPPEIYEIWSGPAVVYMQEFIADDPGRCFAVSAQPGEIVVVPPGWAHATLSASPEVSLTFGALCDREYAFEYEQIRARRGMAWYALIDCDSQLEWHPNPHYNPSELSLGVPRRYEELGLEEDRPLYSQFETDPATLQWVSEPARVSDVWSGFVPCHIEQQRCASLQ